MSMVREMTFQRAVPGRSGVGSGPGENLQRGKGKKDLGRASFLEGLQPRAEGFSWASLRKVSRILGMEKGLSERRLG